MTSDGVDGTAAEDGPGVGSQDRAPGSSLIKADDERLGQRYIEPRDPHVPATLPPRSARRERQVASALRDCIDFVSAIPASGAAASGGRGDISLCATGRR